MDTPQDVILRMSHSYFSETQATPDSIRDFISRMKLAFGTASIDESWLFNKIESNYSVIIGNATVLQDKTNHEDWFNPATNAGIRRDIKWHFWDHYKGYLSSIKGWSPNIVDSMDSLSSVILSNIEDPQRPGRWDCRGMVMGSVQSGKTANYTALIAKAADAGYKLFIVMAGVHNSLRSQTQSRLNEEFLGYDLDKIQKLTGGEKRIGVRQIYSDHKTVFTLTSSNEMGDFKTNIAKQSGIFPSKDAPPIILIIKKHVTILKNVVKWLPSVIGEKDPKGRDLIPDIPVLVIDDECDYASVNTKKVEIDENTGKPLEEWDPTKTNKLIREILFLFDKSVYVGYTATPYANIFIHKDHTHERYGEDLFPKNFIISLPQPSNYLSPEKVFGLENYPHRNIEEVDPLPLTRVVEDYDDIIQGDYKKDDLIESVPESMKRAIKSFLLCCAVRSIRKEGTPHNSMLIHVTRYVAVQEQVYQLVGKELRRMAARIMSGEELIDFREIWENDFLPSTRVMADRGFLEAVEHSWEEVLNKLHQTTRVVKVKLINGTGRDSLDYKDVEVEAKNRIQNGEKVPWEEKGLNVIVIGGDKLSRGLTLEGLSTSYFLRTTKMYDTLMQMGRWFGYRDGFSDLCRIYTTGELFLWYRHIAGATKELREDIDYMAALGETPTNFGLKVRSHPGRLMVTSTTKSRNARAIEISYSGKISETIIFDRKHLKNNMQTLQDLIKEINRPYDKYNPKAPRFQWKNVPASTILNFLHKYRINDGAIRLVKPDVLADYIEQQNKNEELVEWDVVLVSKSGDGPFVEIQGYRVHRIERTAFNLTNDSITIKRLVNPPDEHLDLSDEEMEKAKEFYDSNKENIKTLEIAVRHVRPEKRGLLLLYIIYGENKKTGVKYGIDSEDVVGFAISFPTSDNAVPVEYVVNPVWMEEKEHYV